MSNVIKLRKQENKVNVKVNIGMDDTSTHFETEEEILNRKLKEAFEKGYAKAQQDLSENYQSELNDKLKNEKKLFHEKLLKIDETMKTYEQKFSEIVLSVSILISKKILKHEIEKDSPLIENLKSIAQKLIGANYLLIKCNEAEMTRLKESSDNIFSDANFSKVKFEADNSIEMGGFVVESDIGNIDGKISSQLSEIKKGIENLALSTKDQ